MFITKAPVKKLIELENNIYILKLFSPEIAEVILPGQFLNIKVTDFNHPLLRRPFSVCDVEGELLSIMFNILGTGTKKLASKHSGNVLDILGPLGNGFNLEGDYEVAIIVGGGLGVAPFPYLIKKLNNRKEIFTFIGGKTKDDIITFRMENIHISTDDGSLGTKGNVVELLKQHINNFKNKKIKVFGCGPTAMLRALKDFCLKNDLDCEVSTECAMACGFGICQGCPIKSTKHPEKYLLVCKDGPVFNIKDVII